MKRKAVKKAKRRKPSKRYLRFVKDFQVVEDVMEKINPSTFQYDPNIEGKGLLRPSAGPTFSKPLEWTPEPPRRKADRRQADKTLSWMNDRRKGERRK